jgi:hypothetical protein
MHSISEQESHTFAQSVEELKIRLGALDKTSKFASGSAGTNEWSEDVESIHQRLDRLQRSLLFESRSITGDEK